VKRSSLNPDDHIFATHFHYKIKSKNGAFEQRKVRLVVQGQHMKKKNATGSGDFEDSFSSVPHASDLHLKLALVTQHNMFTDHVDISQAFVQGDLLTGDDHTWRTFSTLMDSGDLCQFELPSQHDPTRPCVCLF
jgi:hypothetical protein